MPVAIVTGSESGIGKATALALAERGFDVGITWHFDEDAAREAVREVESNGVRSELRRTDFAADPASGGTVVGELADALGGIDVLVNNAGAAIWAPFIEMELDSWQQTLNLDLTTPFAAGQEAARRMIAARRGGRIVNVTSVHEHVPLQDAAGYVSAKHGLGGLTKQMAFELARYGITVNAVAPGEIATRMSGEENVDPTTVERPGIPIGRPGSTREVAAAIAFLASEEASYVTGESFVVDGGMLLMAAAANRALR
jgi:NAD(P)-dependent dehydrogenase (short-subunit alcohol dehydrogenase family)